MTFEAHIQDDTSVGGDWICRWTCTCGDYGPWTSTRSRAMVQATKDAHRARHHVIAAAYDRAVEDQLRAQEAAEDDLAHANGDLCADHECSDCWPYDGGAENDSEDHLIDGIREGWIR